MIDLIALRIGTTAALIALPIAAIGIALGGSWVWLALPFAALIVGPAALVLAIFAIAIARGEC